MTLGWWASPSSSDGGPGPLQAFCERNPSIHRRVSSVPVPLLEQLLPMAVERGRRTYSHRSDCRYLGSNGAWGRSGGGGGGEQDEVDLVSLCSCGAGRVRGGVGLLS